MSLLIRTGTVVVVLGTLAAAATALRPSWASDMGIDVWNQAGLEQQIADDAQSMADMEARDAAVLQRIAVKEIIIRHLIEGRMGLPEAAARFRKLNAAVPTYMAIIRMTHEGCSDEEAVCRNVIAFADAQLAQTSPSRREEVLARLELELKEFLAGDESARAALPPG